MALFYPSRGRLLIAGGRSANTPDERPQRRGPGAEPRACELAGAPTSTCQHLPLGDGLHASGTFASSEQKHHYGRHPASTWTSDRQSLHTESCRLQMAANLRTGSSPSSSKNGRHRGVERVMPTGSKEEVRMEEQGWCQIWAPCSRSH